MSNVVGGSAYSGNYSSGGSGYGGSGYGGSGYGGSGGYGGYGSKEEKKKNDSSGTYNYGNSVGHYGDYSYGKSTLDKYKDSKSEGPSSNSHSEAAKKE